MARYFVNFQLRKAAVSKNQFQHPFSRNNSQNYISRSLGPTRLFITEWVFFAADYNGIVEILTKYIPFLQKKTRPDNIPRR